MLTSFYWKEIDIIRARIREYSKLCARRRAWPVGWFASLLVCWFAQFAWRARAISRPALPAKIQDFESSQQVLVLF